MRIGIDATFTLHGGGGVHLERILAAWTDLRVHKAHEIVIFTRQDNLLPLQHTMHGAEWITVLGSRSTAPQRLMWQQLSLPRLTEELRLDVLFCPGNTSPWRGSTPRVVVVHNAAPFSASIRLSTEGIRRWLAFQLLGVLVKRSVQFADRTIFLSSYLRRRFRELGIGDKQTGELIYLGRDAQPEGVLLESLRSELRLTEPFLLCVSHIYPYKNLPALVEGYVRQAKSLRTLGLHLYIVGKAVCGGEYRRIQRVIRRERLEEWVHLPGPVPERQVTGLMSLAHASVFQSTCENCPSTLIEALGAGVPIACSAVAPMPEMAGDAAVYFNPYDPEEIGRTLVRVASDAPLRSMLVENAQKQLLKFPTWQEAAELTLRVLERAARKEAGVATLQPT